MYHVGMVEVRELRSKEQTGAEMKDLVRRYSSDLQSFQYERVPLDQMQFRQFFDLVKHIPYRQDTEGVEVVTRPFHVLTHPWRGLDCKKKAILIASWLEQNQIPWRFVSVSSRPDREIHHVIVEADAGDGVRQIDATYPENKLGERTNWTKAEALTGARSGRAPVLVSMYGRGAPSAAIAADFAEQAVEMGVVSAAVVTGLKVAAIITGIVGTAATTVIGIATAVASRRRARRAREQATALLTRQAEIRAEAEDIRETQQREQTQTLIKWGVPIAAAGALLLL